MAELCGNVVDLTMTSHNTQTTKSLQTPLLVLSRNLRKRNEDIINNMNIKTFINRPIMSVMLSAVIVIIGIIGLLNLPIEQYPDIAPPTVKVSATYTGANAETIMKSVVTPLEASINGVENMQYTTSNAANNGTPVFRNGVSQIVG